MVSADNRQLLGCHVRRSEQPSSVRALVEGFGTHAASALRARRQQSDAAWGGPIEEIRRGDVVWFSPGEKHWHGAAPTTAMTHIAIQEKLDGKPVDWLEHATADQYEGRSSED